MGSMEREKGASFERDVANEFKEVFPSARRGLGQARDAGEVADVAEVGPFWPECKHHKKTNARAALAQAVKASKKSGRIPIAVCKDNFAEPTVTMRFSDFLALLKSGNLRPPL
jgi:hypothetical protein